MYDPSIAPNHVVRTGLEVLLERRLYAKERIGLITNHTGVDRHLEQNIDLLLRAGYRLEAVFSPEHGLYGDHPDGMPVDEGIDLPAKEYGKGSGGAGQSKKRIPVFSLYGKNLAPTAEKMRDLTALIFDIQDIGSRYYTYTSTLVLSMEAASREGKRFIVLDRPNPIGGNHVEGNLPHAEWKSFVCGADVPIRHGLTLGEIAIIEAARKNLPQPEVVPMEGWTRSMFFHDTNLPWVPTSPNAPTLDMAILYPGTCLIEGTNLSEGRGTSTPFQTIGAPWVDSFRLARELRCLNLPGVAIRPAYFQPWDSKWSGQVCGGVQFHVLNPGEVRPVELGVRFLVALSKAFPGDFSLREPEPGGRYALNCLTGSVQLSQALKNQESPEKLLDSWQAESAAFQKAFRSYLLYK